MADGPEEESPESKRLTAILERINVLLDTMENMPLYRGKLSPKQVAEGMNAASRNATRLLEDAEVLFEAKRFPTATSLAILAIEEAGKSGVLRALAVAQDEDALKQGWKDYRSHQTKNTLWLTPLLVLSGVRTLAGLGSVFNSRSKHPRRLDELKQSGFYTDCFANAEWSEPDQFVDELIAEFILKTARSLTKKPAATEREIELWIEHVGPNLGKASPRDLKRFWVAMQKEGLTAEEAERVDDFLGIIGNSEE